VKHLCLILTIALLGGCSTLKREKPQTAVMSCVKEIPQAPGFYSDADLKAMNDAQLFQGIWANWLMSQGYTEKLVAALTACKG
jgi:hypothetical protein